jgi:hypothetical protein
MIRSMDYQRRGPRRAALLWKVDEKDNEDMHDNRVDEKRMGTSVMRDEMMRRYENGIVEGCTNIVQYYILILHLCFRMTRSPCS